MDGQAIAPAHFHQLLRPYPPRLSQAPSLRVRANEGKRSSIRLEAQDCPIASLRKCALLILASTHLTLTNRAERLIRRSPSSGGHLDMYMERDGGETSGLVTKRASRGLAASQCDVSWRQASVGMRTGATADGKCPGKTICRVVMTPCEMNGTTFDMKSPAVA